MVIGEREKVGRREGGREVGRKEGRKSKAMFHNNNVSRFRSSEIQEGMRKTHV